jgi:hypothetical protein
MSVARIDPLVAGVSFLMAFYVGRLRRLPPILRRGWIWLTYWRVKCDGCDGTGLCKGQNQLEPHSCCGDCLRRWVKLADVPAGFMNAGGGDDVLIGDGIMWRRPWSRRQVLKP